MPFIPKRWVLLLGAVMAAGCADHSPQLVRIRLEVPSAASAAKSRGLSSLTAASTVDDFNCVALNVTGAGIATSWAGFKADAPAQCAGPGLVSDYVSTATGGTLELRVPAGTARVVQVLGIKTADGTCPTKNLVTELPADPTATDAKFPAYVPFEIGRQTTDTLQETNIDIPISYSPTAALPLNKCLADATRWFTPCTSGSCKFYLYVLNLNLAIMHPHELNITTGVPSTRGADVSTGASSFPVSGAADPFGRFIYEVNSSPATVGSFVVSKDGTATSAGTAGVAQTGAGGNIGVSPLGNLVFVTNSSSNSVSTFSVNQTTGVLTNLSNTTGLSAPVGAAAHPFLSVFYAANLATANIQAFSYDATTGGSITSLGTVASGGNPRNPVIDPSGKFLYATNNGGTISGYSINSSTGVLTAISTSPFTAFSGVDQSVISPNGKFLYAASGFSGKVLSYSIDATTGALTSIGTTITVSGPGGLTIDPLGRFLNITFSGSPGQLRFYAIGTDGVLTEATSAGSPFSICGPTIWGAALIGVPQ